MQLIIDEAQSSHLFTCLEEGNKAFKRALKTAEQLRLPTKPIEEELVTNRDLRRLVNPNAVEDEGDGRDRAQLDIEDAIEGATETGGATKLRIDTGAAATDEQIRDAFYEIGITIPLSAIADWTPEERAHVETYLGRLVAANTVGGTVQDEPMPLYNCAVANDTIEERIAMGPYIIFVEPVSGSEHPGYRVQHGETGDIRYTLPDPMDAAYFCAKLNIERLRNADITDEEIATWYAAGPWEPVLEPKDDDVGVWLIRAGTQEEVCDTEDEANARAARYNRNLAGRGAASLALEPTT